MIEEKSDFQCELVIIKTTGDMILSVPLSQVGGKGLFVKEIEEALIDDSIDMAVHSMKDVPAFLPEGLILGAILKREDPRDAFVSPHFPSIESLPSGSRIGTSSLRRIAQLKHSRNDLQFLSLRGNVGTRLKKLDDGLVDAIILASAGLIRLGYADRISQFLPTDLSLPAVGQGALGLEFRKNDRKIEDLLSTISDRETTFCVQAERGVLAALNGGCQLPLAAYAQMLSDNSIEVTARVLDPEGSVLIEEKMTGPCASALDLGVEVGNRLLARGGKALLDAVYNH
jgi:hydroxymethylbilane synthase